jgi:N-acetylmuramoyl-L-alanine amidase
VLILDGMKDKYYRVNVGKKESLWVSGDNVVIATNIEGRILATVSGVKFESDKLFDYFKLDLNMPVAYKITEIDNNLELNIYGLKYSKDLIDAIVAQSIFTNAKIKSTSNDNFVIEFPSDKKLWGYDCYYEGNKLIFKKRKTPEINVKKPLDKITIAIDAGHGGPDSGALGPTGEKEKNITLDIAKKIETELKNAGATVILTRTDDTAVDLFDRVKTAKNNNALISISIHANALPDGQDPMIKHGTSSYYYHKEAKDLAQTLKYQIVTDLGTKDDGCAKGSFVLTRSTAPLSVLIEIAYMIHPEEYQLLLNENFRQNAAVSIRTIKNFVCQNRISCCYQKFEFF